MSDMAHKVESVRRFNRFYTKRIGLLHEGLLESGFSLTQARVLFELAHGEDLTASTLRRELGLDAGYLSRILRRFADDGLVEKHPAPGDGRKRILQLTGKGREAFATLDSRSREEVSSMLRELSEEDQDRFLGATHRIMSVYSETPPGATFVLRPHRSGDLGWVVHRHGVLYAQEYGWDEEFEALVAGIVSDFVKHHDPRRERSWIAEMDGEIVGSVFIAKGSETVARLRLLLVEPRARGRGLGKRLVEECIRFSRSAGYRKITLWTNSVLLPARHIYRSFGFRIVKEEQHHSYGHDLVGETWELDLVT